MPVDRSKYPADWLAIRARIQARAKDRCEGCGVENHAVGYRRRDGSFYRMRGSGPCDFAGYGQSHPSGQRISHSEALEFAAAANTECGLDADGNHWFVIVCTVAHVNHDTTDNDDGNLRFWCQACHNRHDVLFRKANRAKRKDAERLLLVEENF